MSTAARERQTTTQQQQQQPQDDFGGLGPRKTLFVLVTVVGCIAILWPKIFYPMMFGSTDDTATNNLHNIHNIHNLRPGGKL